MAFDIAKKFDSMLVTVSDTAAKGAISLVSTSFDIARAFDSNVMGVVDKVSDTVIDAFAQMADAGVAFVKDFVDEGISFDAAMGNAGAIALKTRDELDEATISVGNFTGNLRDYAKMLGATTRFTATDSANALQYMFLAGYDEQTSAEMLPKVLDLAAAGMMDLGTASDMVTDAQTALGISMENMTNFVDQLAKTASSSNTSVQQLGEGLLSLGATGRIVHGGFEELNVVLAVLANNGKKGSEGGNDLRRILTRLVNPTKDASLWFEKLGVSVYDATTGQLKDLPTLFTELGTAMESLSEQQRNQAVSDIFGQYALASANALLNTSAERWTELREKIHDADGAARNMASIQLETLSGQITLLQSALSGVKIALFDKLALPSLKDFVQTLTTGISKVADDIENGEFDEAFIDLGGTTVTLISKGVALFLTNKDKIQETSEAVINFLDRTAQTVIEAGVNTMPTMIRLVTSLLSTLIGSISDFVSDPQNLSAVRVTINDFLNVVGQFFEENKDNFNIILSTVFDLGIGIFGKIFIQKRKFIYSVLFTQLSNILGDLKDNLDTLLNGQETQTLVSNALEFIGKLFNLLINFTLTALPQVVDFALGIAEKVLNAISEYIADPVNKTKVRWAINRILTSLENFWEDNQWVIERIITDFFDIAKDFIVRVWAFKRQVVVDTIRDVIIDELFTSGELYQDSEGNFLNLGNYMAQGIINGFVDGLSGDIISDIAPGLELFLSAIALYFGIHSPSTVMHDKIGKNLAYGIGTGFEDTIGEVSEEMAKSIPDNFGITPEMTTISKSGSMDVYNFEIHIGSVNGASQEDAYNLGETLSEMLYSKIYREKAAII